MMILTGEQMRFAAWQIANSDCEALADCLAVHADLQLESVWERFRTGEATHADILAIVAENEREIRANPAIRPCPDFDAHIARLLATLPH